MLRSASIDQADCKARQIAGSVYKYRIDFEPQVLDRLSCAPQRNRLPPRIRNQSSNRFIGAGPEVDRLSAQTMQASINFARTGKPSQARLHWPPYNAARRLNMTGPD